MRRTRSTSALVAAAVAVAGCGSNGQRATAPGASMALASMTLSSPAFHAGGMLLQRFTCQGEGAAPPLRWAAVPRGARELALVVEDPDASRGRFFHWVVLAIPATSHGLPAGTKPTTLRLGRASSGRVGYQPPCPPRGDRPHRYVFTLYALKRPLGLPQGTSAERVLRAAASNTLARGVLVGRFSRPG